jgi:hypothetical protein
MQNWLILFKFSQREYLQQLRGRGLLHMKPLVFRRLQQEQPALFSQATLSRIDLGPQAYSARVGPFASEKDAAAACLALAAADIRCF